MKLANILIYSIFYLSFITCLSRKHNLITHLNRNHGHRRNEHFNSHKLKRDNIPRIDASIEKATEAITKLLDENIAQKVKEARKDLETILISSLDKRILETASNIHHAEDCYDILDNCYDLKASNVCDTSADAMKISCKKTCGFCAYNTSLPTLPLETEIPKNEKQKTEIVKSQFKDKKAVKSLKKSEKSQKLKSKNNLSPIPTRKHLSVIPIKPKKIRKKHHVKPNIRKKPFVKSKTLTKYTCPSICQKVCLKGCPIKCCKPLEHRNRPSPINTIIPPTSCSPECLKSCNLGCPEQCCLRNFFVELAKNAESYPFAQDPINTISRDINQYNQASIGPVNQGEIPFTNCDSNCPRSCFPLCNPECCYSSVDSSENPVNVFQSAVDSSIKTAEKIAQNENDQNSLMFKNPEILPSIDFNSIAYGSNVEENNLEPVDNIYILPSNENNNQQLNQASCPVTCTQICYEYCPKRCCVDNDEEIITSLQLEDDSIQKKICAPECSTHCTPGCLYNHCCEDK